MKSNGTASWNKSDMLFTNISRPLAHPLGISREASSSVIFSVHLALPPVLRVVILYFFCPIASSRFAIRIALPFVQPGDKIVQPPTGFQVASVHSIDEATPISLLQPQTENLLSHDLRVCLPSASPGER